MGIMDSVYEEKEKREKKNNKIKGKLNFLDLELCFYFCCDVYLLFVGLHKGVLYGFCA